MSKEAEAGSNSGSHPKLVADSQVGTGRFTLIKELGRGGMGVVWLAQDNELLERVALKFLPPEVCRDPVALSDLRRETVRSHHLTHPRIVRIHDFHQQADGVAFISMEYVDGPTLSGLRLQQTRRVFTWEELAPLVLQLCEALEYAHGEGVIHRDLKPANVMLDSRGRVKLADFGIAAVVTDSMTRVTTSKNKGTGTGGTLAYMSPQQLRGKSPSVADDVYALGACLYELLASRPPFYTGDITHQVLNEPPTPLGERMRDLGVDNPVPAEVAALIMECLSKDPAKRPPSVQAVADRVKLALQKEAPEKAGLKEEKAPKGSPVWKAALVAVLAIGLGVAGWERFFPPGPISRLVTILNPEQPTNGPTNVVFSQSFLVQASAGNGDLPTNGDLVLVIQCLGAVSNAPVGVGGQAMLKDLPASWKQQDATVSLRSRDWQLADTARTVRLSGQSLTLALERRDILIHGRVSDARSDVPIAEADVSVGGVTNVTDTWGQFSLAIPGRSVGATLTLMVRHPSHQPLSKMLTNLAEAQLVSLIPSSNPPPPSVAEHFSQVLLVHGPGGASDLLGSGDVELTLESQGKTYSGVLLEPGKVVFAELPLASKNQPAKIKLSSQGWQLAEGASSIELTGQPIAITLERRGIVIHGSVTVTNSSTPVADALVAIGGTTNATDKDGHFSVTVPGRLVGGPLTLTAIASGYLPFSETISAPAKEQAVALSPRPLPPPSPPDDLLKYPVGDEAFALLQKAQSERANGTPRSLRKTVDLLKQAEDKCRVSAKKDFPKFGTSLAVVLLLRAETLAMLGDQKESGRCYLEAKDTAQSLGAKNPYAIPLAQTFHTYAVALIWQRDPRQDPRIVDACQQAITGFSNALQWAPGLVLPRLAPTYHSLGAHQKALTNLVGALSSYEKAVGIYEALPSGAGVEVISRRLQAQSEFAELLANQGQREAARTNYLAAIAACEGLKPGHERSYLEKLAGIEKNYGYFLNNPFPPNLRPDPAAALHAYEQAVSLYGKLAVDTSWTNHVDFAETLNNYALLLASLYGTNRNAEVDLAYRTAKAQSQKAGDGLLEMKILSNWGSCLEDRRLLAEACEKYSMALKVGASHFAQQPAEIGALLADFHLRLAEVAYRQATVLTGKEQVSRLEDARDDVIEARKLIKKLPSTYPKIGLEGAAQVLATKIENAMPR